MVTTTNAGIDMRCNQQEAEEGSGWPDRSLSTCPGNHVEHDMSVPMSLNVHFQGSPMRSWA
eukprot:8828600-Karenia_brevis.AAC.1